mmetsp:Transcript_43628/g.102885  ORF Transcript_43628/g.102885 Transcript_43628/m.102885 type:complete len:832 (-) Transcript_43628:60-2555(-)
MPLPITFDWSEDENGIFFDLHIRGAKAKNIDIQLCDVYVKVNCHPSFFEVDLRHEIDLDHPKTLARVGAGKVTLSLRKKVPGLWKEFRAEGTKAEVRERRRLSLEAAVEREKDLEKQKEERKEEKLKAGEHEQWRLDRENREQIEKWEAEEKERWEKKLLGEYDEDEEDEPDAAAAQSRAPSAAEIKDAMEEVPLSQPESGESKAADQESSQPQSRQKRERSVKFDLEDKENVEEKKAPVTVEQEPVKQHVPLQPVVSTPGPVVCEVKEVDPNEACEEYVPPPRENPGKIGVRFSERPRPGVPVRDRGGQRAPPFPKGTVKSEMPPMMAGTPEEDENDPVWLKDKADNLMVAGDYQGAYNAYTQALKISLNARAFANRAVADLYLGNFTQCIEDGTRALNVLDARRRVPEGHMPPPEDPEDAMVRARVEVRIATAYLWSGAFKKAEEHMQKALDVEAGLDVDERQKVKDDLDSCKRAREALVLKEKGDHAARGAHGGGDKERTALSTALGLYEDAAQAQADSAVLLSNRCFAHLRAGNLQACLADGEQVLALLKQWPIARRAPKAPARPSRLDPPYLDDPTFKHPDEVKQGEVEWLMKHQGGGSDALPELPPEYEWVKDVAEKSDDAWIAIKKKMSKATIDRIRRATSQLQDALYTRNPQVIREQVEIAIPLNKAGEGPSSKAIHQCSEYAQKLEDHARDQEQEKAREEGELRQEVEECDLTEELALMRRGRARAGFSASHPTESLRRRLFVKVRLRRAKAYELLGNSDLSMEELRIALRVEPKNEEALRSLAELESSTREAEEALRHNDLPYNSGSLITAGHAPVELTAH